MLSMTMKSTLQTVLAFVFTMSLLLILAVPASANETTGNDTANVKQTTLAETGDTAADAKSTAHAGAATALGQVQIHQVNVQVIAGPKDTRDNSTQSATNTANATQTTAAISGDALATDGGRARSGNAHANSLTIIHQINIQIIAGHAPSGGVHQTASNDATVDQTTVAASGDAGASGSGSTAASGDATASSVAAVQQRNFQLFVGKGPSTSDDPVQQVASNTASVDQTTAAISGPAVAIDGDAASGDAKAKARAIVDQSNTQVVK